MSRGQSGSIDNHDHWLAALKSEHEPKYSLSEESQLSLVDTNTTGPHSPQRGSDVGHPEAGTCASQQFRSNPRPLDRASSADRRFAIAPFRFPDSRSRCRRIQRPVGQSIEKLIEPVDQNLGEVFEHTIGHLNNADGLVLTHTRHCRAGHRRNRHLPSQVRRDQQRRVPVFFSMRPAPQRQYHSCSASNTALLRLVSTALAASRFPSRLEVNDAKIGR